MQGVGECYAGALLRALANVAALACLECPAKRLRKVRRYLMAIPAAGPAVAFTLDDITVDDSATIKLVAVVGKITGDFKRFMGGTGVVVQAQNIIEQQDHKAAPILPDAGGVVDFNTANGLQYNTSTTGGNAIGGVYEYVAYVLASTQPDDLIELRFRFQIDEQTAYTLDANGRIPFAQVATESESVTQGLVVLTPGVILADLKTVDGPGSGLDADLLDGKEGAAYDDATAAVQSNVDAEAATRAAADTANSNATAAVQSNLDAEAVARASVAADLAAEIATTDDEQWVQDGLIASNKAAIDAHTASGPAVGDASSVGGITLAGLELRNTEVVYVSQTDFDAEGGRAWAFDLVANPLVGHVRFGPGVFACNNNNMTPAPGTKISGSGKPNWNGTGLVGGTVISQGAIRLDGAALVTIEDLGVDVSATSSVRDAINSGTSGPGYQSVVVRNVATHGQGGGHGCVLTSGDGNLVEGFEAYDFDHGLIFRCSDSSGTNLHFEDINIFAVGFKSETSFGACRHNVVANVVSKGGGRIAFQGDDEPCELNKATNVVVDGGNFGATFTGAECKDNTFSGTVIEAATAGVWWKDDAGPRNLAQGVYARKCQDSFVDDSASGAVLVGCVSSVPVGADLAGTGTPLTAGVSSIVSLGSNQGKVEAAAAPVLTGLSTAGVIAEKLSTTCHKYLDGPMIHYAWDIDFDPDDAAWTTDPTGWFYLNFAENALATGATATVFLTKGGTRLPLFGRLAPNGGGARLYLHTEDGSTATHLTQGAWEDGDKCRGSITFMVAP